MHDFSVGQLILHLVVCFFSGAGIVIYGSLIYETWRDRSRVRISGQVGGIVQQRPIKTNLQKIEAILVALEEVTYVGCRQDIMRQLKDVDPEWPLTISIQFEKHQTDIRVLRPQWTQTPNVTNQQSDQPN